MEPITDALQHPFTWGLLLGLLVAAFLWKSGFSARRNVARELKRVEEEMKTLQNHLNTQLKINASGNEALQTELDTLRKQNETLRVNNAALQQKPGRAEQRLLQVYEMAIRSMREQAMRQAESDVDAAESGLRKLVRRVIPGLGNSSAQPALLANEDNHEQP